MSKIRLLIAEDDPAHRGSLERALLSVNEPLEIRFEAEPTGVLHAAHERKFDCFILDFSLPPLTATELVPKLTTLQPETPVIVISSNRDQQVVIDALRTGVDNFVPMPAALEGDTLWRHVDRSIRARRRSTARRRAQDRRLKSMERLACTDPLTGLFNRRHAERILKSARVRRDRRAKFSCALIDIDHFKRVNDRHGHAAGDSCLKTIAGVIRSSADPTDVCVRWGGEEFLVLKPGASLATTAAWAASLRVAIEERAGRAESNDIAVTASLGVATVPTRELDIGVVDLADRALYCAKDGGRNRVATYEMVRITEAAEEVGASPGMTPDSAARQFLDDLGPEIGDVQRAHIVAHGERVRRTALELARNLRLSPELERRTDQAAAWHDIGKLGVPESLLAKPGPLSDGERLFMEEHSRFGAELLDALRFDTSVVQIVEMHHTPFATLPQGTPDTLRDQERMIISIIAVADALDTMTTVTPDIMRRSRRDALIELKNCIGTQFDPDAVDAALRVSGEPSRIE